MWNQEPELFFKKHLKDTGKRISKIFSVQSHLCAIQAISVWGVVQLPLSLADEQIHPQNV